MNYEHTVCVVDDDPGVLRALTRLLDAAGFDVHGFANADAFLDHAESEIVGCAVLDLSMPPTSGLQIQAELFDRGIDCPIVFLSGYADVPTSVQAMRAGAVDFLTKPVEEAALIDAVNAALRQHVTGIEHRDELAALQDRWTSLTPREQEVCRLVAAGHLNKEIAVSLGTTEKTIKVHRGRAMRKMQARRVADLVRMAGQLDEMPSRE